MDEPYFYPSHFQKYYFYIDMILLSFLVLFLIPVLNFTFNITVKIFVSNLKGLVSFCLLLIPGWNKLHFASARTLQFAEMFAVHDPAHKNRALMSSPCTGTKMSAKTPLC